MMLSGLLYYSHPSKKKNKFARTKQRTLAPPEGRSLFGTKGDMLGENVISTEMGGRGGLALCGHRWDIRE